MKNKKEFNKLERAILEWIIANISAADLIAQINAAALKEREWTKVGFYIDFNVPKTLNPIEQKDYTIYKHKGNFPLNIFPIIKSKDIDDIAR